MKGVTPRNASLNTPTGYTRRKLNSQKLGEGGRKLS